jgi:SAM-dependent methyltransferase
MIGTARVALAVMASSLVMSCSPNNEQPPAAVPAATTTPAPTAAPTAADTAHATAAASAAPGTTNAATAPTATTAAATTADPKDDLTGRVPDIEYVPTPQNVVEKLLEAAKVNKDDVLYDLGCGDGRIVVTAAKKFGVKAKGFDIDPKRVAESKANVKKAGVEHLVTIEHRDIFSVDLSPASVVTLYLLPELNVRLIPQLEKLKPGSRIVSHDFDMEGVDPELTWTVIAKDHRTPKDREHYVYLWKTPLKKSKPAAPAKK